MREAGMKRLTWIIVLAVLLMWGWAFAPAFAQPACWPNTTLPISVHRADVSAPT
jgi:hypothetical protein